MNLEVVKLVGKTGKKRSDISVDVPLYSIIFETRLIFISIIHKDWRENVKNPEVIMPNCIVHGQTTSP